jgi:hypothetical protein
VDIKENAVHRPVETRLEILVGAVTPIRPGLARRERRDEEFPMLGTEREPE